MICETCRKWPATLEASRNDETWMACTSCRDQAERKGADVTYQPLPTEAVA